MAAASIFNARAAPRDDAGPAGPVAPGPRLESRTGRDGRADGVQLILMESFLTHTGYAALIIFGFIEACSIPISSEITFGFAGVLAYQGHLNLVLVIVIGSLAELAGSYVSYTV